MVTTWLRLPKVIKFQAAFHLFHLSMPADTIVVSALVLDSRLLASNRFWEIRPGQRYTQNTQETLDAVLLSLLGPRGVRSILTAMRQTPFSSGSMKYEEAVGSPSLLNRVTVS